MTYSRRTPARERKPSPPLDAEALSALALRYVERFATSEAKLRAYLRRKVRERGWDGAEQPPIEAVAARMAELHYVDDRSFGEARARGLARRGYGRRRIAEALTAAGLDPELRTEIGATVNARDAAIAFARRRRFGPFSREPVSFEQQQKQFAAMLRAGHAPDLARAILTAPDEDALARIDIE